MDRGAAGSFEAARYRQDIGKMPPFDLTKNARKHLPSFRLFRPQPMLPDLSKISRVFRKLRARTLQQALIATLGRGAQALTVTARRVSPARRRQTFKKLSVRTLPASAFQNSPRHSSGHPCHYPRPSQSRSPLPRQAPVSPSRTIAARRGLVGGHYVVLAHRCSRRDALPRVTSSTRTDAMCLSSQAQTSPSPFADASAGSFSPVQTLRRPCSRRPVSFEGAITDRRAKYLPVGHHEPRFLGKLMVVPRRFVLWLLVVDRRLGVPKKSTFGLQCTVSYGLIEHTG